MGRDRPNKDEGFVLIGVVWLLLLATAIVAAILLRARHDSDAARQAAVEVQGRLDLETVVETVSADLLIRGGASRWSVVPASGQVQVGDHDIAVATASETGLLDLNSVDLALLARALQGLGLSPRERDAFVARLTQRRSQGRITSTAGANALIAMLPGSFGGGRCWADLFTTSSGLVAPTLARSPATLASALGSPLSEQSGPLRAGEIVRIRVTNQAGLTLQARVRPIATFDQIAPVGAWEIVSPCS